MRNLDEALDLTRDYLRSIRREQENALEAIEQVEAILKDSRPTAMLSMKRKEVAEHLNISMDTLATGN
jgi:uncharacterized protein YnzC (UPF0291/DUF896 family)